MPSLHRNALLLCVALSSALGCAPGSVGSTESPIIVGGDDRSPEVAEPFASAVGALVTDQGECTTFAVSATEIVTAGHCLSGLVSAPRAVFGDLNNPTITRSIVSVDADEEHDIARLRLGSPLPEFLTVAAPVAGPAELVSLDADTYTLETSPRCTITLRGPRLLAHDCDTLPGSSGGALIQNGHVVGVHIGASRAEGVNFAVSLAGASGTEIPAGLSKERLETNRDEVRANVAAGGWHVVWGKNIDELEYARLTAAVAASIATANPGPLLAYFDAYLDQTIEQVKREVPEVSEDVIRGAIVRALNGGVISEGRLGIKAGIATYQRSDVEEIRYPEITCNWHGCTTKWSTKEIRTPLPNHHTPYVAFRY